MTVYTDEVNIYNTDAIAQDIAEAGAANEMVTSIGSTGVQVHPAGQSGSGIVDYTQIDANGVKLYKGGAQVASFGDSATIGKENGPRIEMDESGLSLYSGSTPTEIAHFGRNDTSRFNYYTMGVRKSAYSVGGWSCAFGAGVAASGAYSFASGGETVASGGHSTAMNEGTIASKTGQTAIGKYNIEDPAATNIGTYAFIIGNGDSDSARSNAFTVDWNGNVEAAGTVNNHAPLKTLWSGTWSSGTLKVAGISDYKMLEISFASEGTHAQCFVTGSGTSAYVRGSNSYTDGSSIVDYIVGLDLNMNTDTLTWVACKKRPMTISSKAIGTIANLTVTSIIGVL